MKKINKRKIAILILIVLILITIIRSFNETRTTKITEVTAVMVDNSSLITDVSVILKASTENESGISITLPEMIENIKVKSYIIEKKEINSQADSISKVQQVSAEKIYFESDNVEKINDEENLVLENGTITKDNKETDTQNIINTTFNNTLKDEENLLDNEIKDESVNIPVNETQNVQEKFPGEKIYLTQEEIDSQKIILKVNYDFKNKNETILYAQTLEKEVDSYKVTINGYIPKNAVIQADKVSPEEVEEIAQEFINSKTVLEVAYDIKIIVDGQKFEPNAFDENVEVKISGIITEHKKDDTYKVIHIDDQNKVEEIKDVKIEETDVIFNAKEFSTYAVLSEEGSISTYASRAATIKTQEEWDGTTIANKFAYGNGTETLPYLISDGTELSYLASQVNSGTNYEGMYFQLANDIDLGGAEWTPIGTTNNSFRGIFDGAGHTIANAKITIPDLPDEEYLSYGIFGSIGGGNTRSIIRNVEISTIDIVLTGSGNTGTSNSQGEEGYHIGILVGTMYKNSSVLNDIIKDSSITDTNTITIYNYQFRMAVGGIVGFIANTPGTYTDPGTAARYEIENCFSDTTVDLDVATSFTNNGNGRNGRSQFHTGGIVGTIRSQPVWPKNSLYKGSLSTNGFIGPIFGALINNTSYTSNNNFSTLWNGNDAGNLTTEDLYYSDYTANGTRFTQNVTSGTSTARRSNTRTNIGYVQGVNKGSYTTNMNTMLNMFNENVTDNNKYLTWIYENDIFSFKERFSTTIDEKENFVYQIVVTDSYQTGTYNHIWFIDGAQDTSITGDSYTWIPTYEKDEDIMVITNDGTYYAITKFLIKKIGVDIVFDVNESNDSVIATLDGEGLRYTKEEDYTFQWYEYDIAGDGGPIEGETTLTLNNLQDGMDYKLIATNTVIPELSTENMFTYGDRTVIFVDYADGNNNNDGYTPETAVKTLPTAYGKIDANGSINSNVIVIMGNYTTRDVYYNTKDSTNSTYRKPATITGKYDGIDYDGTLYMYYSSSTYNFINEDTNFQYLTFNGNNGQAYLYAQGYNLTMGKGLHMENYATANTNQGLISGSAPAFHVLGGYLQYNRTQLPRNNGKIIIKSGAYGRVLGGGGSGSSSGAGQTTSHDFTGSNLTTDMYTASIFVNIEESTKGNYTYDINLLVGGSTAGNMYANIDINIENGSIGRLLGGSIGDRISLSNWNYPENTFLGYTTINLNGGTVQELYGGSLGRNMSALSNSGTSRNLVCDIYFYGTININISGEAVVNSNIYGAGAGGVTGYHENSTDTYKSYGQNIPSIVNINITSGTVNGNIYGGGYGYTEYLTENVTARDGGALYGDSNIIISGSPTINGDIFASGCGYNLSSKTEIAQMYGASKIEITGSPNINGRIFGAGAGISGYEEMAKLVGTSEIIIGTNLDTEVYGGGNIAQTEGSTKININSGTHTADIYGGGNEGVIAGNTVVNINGGTQTRVFGGGNKAEVTAATVNINGGTTTEIYAGGNSASVDNTNVYLKGGTAGTIYGGSNQTGIVQKSMVETISGTANTIYGGNNSGGTTIEATVNIKGSNITSAVYGGGNQVDTTKSTINIITTNNVIPNVYGGGNQAGVPNTYIYATGGTVNNIFGGSNTNGEVEKSYIEVNGGTVTNVYGGNNQGGTTLETNINIQDGEVSNVFGGGNEAESDVTNVEISGTVSENVYGGGNQAGINTNTNVNIVGGTIGNNVYGGGNEGTVAENTYVHIRNANIGNSVYAGGNGSTAIVYGNTNLVMDGQTNNITNSVFGGGNKAETGDENKQESVSTVNIVTGTIGKNVYGGANTSVVYGTTQTNIGYDAVNDSTLERGKIEITGTVFGGGEANEAGSEDYDFSYISVTKGIDIQIDANGYETFWVRGSIFGSGNASSTTGESYITIKNYGTVDNPQSNISIQRANCTTLINSAIGLSGTTDRTNEFSTTFFAISRVDRVKLKNGSTLFLCNGANLLKNLDSVVDIDGQEVKSTVTIDPETGATTKNVDNRIYMLEGKVLNVATNEQVTTYGEVYGMMFFGLFTNKLNPGTSTGFYYKGYNNGDTITNAGTFSSNSYVKAQHMTNHDTTVDGFYTNYNEDGIIKVDYIDTTPDEDVYYIWLVGDEMDVTVFEFGLVASKFATLGTYELSLSNFSDKNMKFVLSGFSAGLANGISLINPADIENIAPDEETANSVYGLTMKAGNFAWETKGSTTFLTQNGGTYTGVKEYDKDNSGFTPTFNFCFYHSQNITEEQSLGEIRIRFQVLTPIDELTSKISYIDIIITLTSALYQMDYYEAAITPGQEFDLFTSTDTTITSKSMFSTYYSLFINEFSESDYYENYDTYNRVLVSRDSSNQPYCFPENTKITMLDIVTNKFYYYIVSSADVNSNKYIYLFEDFIAMGSTNGKYDEQEASSLYYNSEQDLIYENFIFHINFADTNIKDNVEANSLLMELRDIDDEILIGVLGQQRGVMIYNVYPEKDATIELGATIDSTSIYLGDKTNINIITDFTQKIESSKTVYDTQYFDKKLGIKISIYDSNGNKLNSDSLLGINFELDGILHYPRIDGTTRIKISDKVTNVFSKIKLNTENNTTLATGDYKIRIESFGSSDGIYYGLESSDMIELELKIIKSSYGLKVKTGDKEKIIDKETGYTLNGNNSLLTQIEYSSSLENPNITVALYRRDYSEIFSQKYILVDLQEYISTDLTKSIKDKEYIVSENPLNQMDKFLLLKSDLLTGTYKLVYKLYDKDILVGEAYEYMIIK